MPPTDPEVLRLLRDRDWLDAQLDRGLTDEDITSLIRARGLRVALATVWYYRRHYHKLPGCRERRQTARQRILRQTHDRKPRSARSENAH